MSRHGRHVPTSFYRRFARDALAFAEEHAEGRLLSVLEGGYSDRALASGAMAWIAGLVEGPATVSDEVVVKREEGEEYTGAGSVRVDESWWEPENLIKVSGSQVLAV